MALGVPSPPWLCNRSGVVLLFRAYGEELLGSGWKKREGGVAKTRPGLVWFFWCGCGSLNMTPDSGWPLNSHRFDSEVKLLSVGICFCLLNNNAKCLDLGIGGKKNEKGFRNFTSTDRNLMICHLYHLCSDGSVRFPGWFFCLWRSCFQGYSCFHCGVTNSNHQTHHRNISLIVESHGATWSIPSPTHSHT